MGKYITINLFFLSVAVFLLSFTVKDNETGSAAQVFMHADSDETQYYTFSLSSPVALKKLSSITVSDMLDEAATPELKSKLAKQKKKCKRLINSLSFHIQPPVKEIDPVVFDIFWKDSYSKPHFLSHIHSFVFRLTPF